MITDGYWKVELKRTISALKRWQKIVRWKTTRLTLHQVNKQFLYSAVIIRKIIEDEKRAFVVLKNIAPNMPPLPIMCKEISVWEYPYIGDSDYVPAAIWVEDYDFNNFEHYNMPLEHICNQIIHSYAWQIIYGKEYTILGIMVASDRYKGKSGFLIHLDDWLDVLKFCVEHCTV